MGKLPKPYKIGIIGLLAILAITIVPFSGETNSTDGKFYGFVTLVAYDENRNEVLSQTIHNRLVDTGETFLLENAFREGNADADNVQISAICIIEDTTVDVIETHTAADFDGNNTITGGNNNCIPDTAADLSTQGLAVIGMTQFTGGTNLANGETINGIGICQSNSGATAFEDCLTTGILFSVIDTSDVTLATSETVDITYTFNMTSPNN